MDHQNAFPLELLPIQTSPFDHISKAGFLFPDVYQELERSFPVCPPSTGPTGFSYYWGDPTYEELITTNWAWKLFFHTAHSQAFVDYCVAQFERAYQEHGCVIDLGRIRLQSGILSFRASHRISFFTAQFRADPGIQHGGCVETIVCSPSPPTGTPRPGNGGSRGHLRLPSRDARFDVSL